MIRFEVSAKTALSPKEIVDGMFDKENWTSFKGAGPVPGIKEVEIIAPDNAVKGAIFRVENDDGSNHEETIIEYNPDHTLVMKLHKFSAPLNKFASHFHEIWTFNRHNSYTNFTRVFELYPKNFWGSVLLRVVSHFLKKGVQNHTKTIVLQD